MFTKPRVTHDDANDRLLPIMNKDFRTSLEEGHSAVLLDPRLENHVIVDHDFAV